MKKKYILFSILLVAISIISFSFQTSPVQADACSLMTASVSPTSGANGQSVTISWRSQGCETTVISGPGFSSNGTGVGAGTYSRTLASVPEHYTVTAMGWCPDPVTTEIMYGNCGETGLLVEALYTVSCTAGSGGSCVTTPQTKTSGSTATFTVSPDSTHVVSTISGCNGTAYSGSSTSPVSYTTGAITSTCTVSATFDVSRTDGACGTSNTGNFYTAPSTNLCSAGTAGTVSTTATGWSWSCVGSGTGHTDAPCSANKKVDCVGSWSTCSNGSQTYTITTTAAYGGTACPATNNQTQTCGTTAQCSATHYNCNPSYGTYAGDGTGGATGPWDWTCNGLNGGSNVACSESANPVAPTVSTGAVTGVLSGSATGHGTISSNGGATVSVSGCAWNTTGNPAYVVGGSNQTTDGYSTGGPYPCSLTGLTAGTTYYVKAYAKNSAGIGYGSQVQFTTLAPDLTVGVASPSSMTIGASTQFSATVTNNGVDSTGASFPNKFQVATLSNGSNAVDYSASNRTALAGGANAGITSTPPTSAFPSVGTYYVRFCTDLMNGLPSPGAIAETNENNNCSPSWTTLTVSSAPVMSGILTSSADSCVIPLNGSSCTVNLTWDTINPVATSAVTSPYPVADTHVSVPDANSGTVNNVTIPYSSRNFYLYNNNQLLVSKTVTSSCGTNTWDGSTKCISSSPVDCVGSWGTCTNGSQTYTITTPASGSGTACPYSNGATQSCKPDLVANNISPTSVGKNSNVVFSADITNVTGFTTGTTFSNLFQIATNPTDPQNPEPSKIVNYPASNNPMPAIVGVASYYTANFTHKFTSTTDAYYMRACADATGSPSDTGSTGTVSESDEGNNCSPNWTRVNVLPGDSWGPWSDCVNGFKTSTCSTPNSCSGGDGTTKTLPCSTPIYKEN